MTADFVPRFLREDYLSGSDESTCQRSLRVTRLGGWRGSPVVGRGHCPGRCEATLIVREAARAEPPTIIPQRLLYRPSSVRT